MHRDNNTNHIIITVTNGLNKKYTTEFSPIEVESFLDLYYDTVKIILEEGETDEVTIPKIGKIVKNQDK